MPVVYAGWHTVINHDNYSSRPPDTFPVSVCHAAFRADTSASRLTQHDFPERIGQVSLTQSPFRYRQREARRVELPITNQMLFGLRILSFPYLRLHQHQKPACNKQPCRRYLEHQRQANITVLEYASHIDHKAPDNRTYQVEHPVSGGPVTLIHHLAHDRHQVRIMKTPAQPKDDQARYSQAQRMGGGHDEQERGSQGETDHRHIQPSFYVHPRPAVGQYPPDNDPGKRSCLYVGSGRNTRLAQAQVELLPHKGRQPGIDKPERHAQYPVIAQDDDIGPGSENGA